MTDKEKLAKVRAEIEKYQKQIQAGAVDNRISKEKAEAYRICVKLISIIDSMQEEPASEDFKTALEKKVREAQNWTYIEEEGGVCPMNEEFCAYDLEEFAMWGANWQKQKDESYTKSMYKVGINTGKELMKQQLMKDTVKVKIINTSIISLPENCNFKVGNKVILIKEDS